VKDAMYKASVLMEALPYIKEHFGKTVVIKYGGNAMVNEELKAGIASDVVLMKYVGMNPVVIHGGGPDISAAMREAKIEVKFVDGLRVTDQATMTIVKAVLAGKINKELVGLVNGHGKLAEGIIGDNGLIAAKKKQAAVDLGFVGEVSGVNPEELLNVISEGYVPIIASLASGADGNTYNINADLAAGEIAAAIGADKIIFLTDVEGLYRDFNDKETLISELSAADCRTMVKEKHVEAGMIPKLEGCLKALDAGVNRAHILDGTIRHALLLEVFTTAGVGTMIT
jgi:acetylglutamate kinase